MTRLRRKRPAADPRLPEPDLRRSPRWAASVARGWLERSRRSALGLGVDLPSVVDA